MDNTVAGIIGAGVLCVILLAAVIAVTCFMYFRYTRSRNDNSRHKDRLIKRQVSNGEIPSVAKFVPYPMPSRAGNLYPYPTIPSRHMATYRPRYVEEANPTGMLKTDRQSVIVKSQTFNGPYTHQSGPVVYDIRQHRGARPQRLSAWSQTDQAEAIATMTLGEESPDSLRPGEFRASVKNKEHAFRESVKTDIRIPSPDTPRRQYLFTTETETPRPPSLSASSNEIRRNSQGIAPEGDRVSDSGREILDSARRQRRAVDGSVLPPPPPDY